MSATDLIAQKKAEIAAKIAAMTGKAPGGVASISAVVSSAPVPARPPVPEAPPSDDLARRVAEAKRRVSEAQTKLAVKDNPYMSMAQTAKKKVAVAEPAPQGAGLKMAAHPLLLDSTPSAPQSKKDRYKPMLPKYTSVKANARIAPSPTPQAASPAPLVPVEVKANPYASGSTTAGAETGFDGAPKERAGRSLKFNQKGKYIQLANQARQEAQLDQLKQRIAESAKKAGLDAEFETRPG